MKIILPPVITIDGPSSSGKGTLCKRLSKILKWNLLDSGVIYRILALLALNQNISIENENKLLHLAYHLDENFNIKKNKLNVLLESKNTNRKVRSEIISSIASKIATLPSIRKALLTYQRKFRITPGLITDGRDMGTVVFPDAQVKIFLNASLEERTYRRMIQLQKKGFNVKFETLLCTIKERDNRDRNRKIAPLVPSFDSLIIDSTYLTIDKITNKVLAHTKKILSL